MDKQGRQAGEPAVPVGEPTLDMPEASTLTPALSGGSLEGSGGASDKQIAALEQVLHEQMAAHDLLRSLLAHRLAALRKADKEQVTACCEQENQQVQRIAELEKKRLALVAQLTQWIDPKAPEPLRMNDLAQRLPDPARSRLLVLRQQLVQRMQQVRTDMSAARRATDALVRHMQGLMQSIGGLMTGVATYSKRGAPPGAAMAVSTFSMTA